MHSIETGVQITRRKFVHILRDPAGETLWTARSIGEVLRVCEARDIEQVEIINEGRLWICKLRPLQPPEG